MRFADYEMERAVLGCMIADRSVIPNIVRAVSEADFSVPFNRELFRKIIEISGRGTQLDAITLNAETGNKDPAYVASITDTVPSGANFSFYCEKVKRLSMTRALYKLLEESRKATPDNVDQVLGNIIASAAEIAEEGGGDDIKTARDYILPMIKDIEKAVECRAALSGYDTGFDNINQITSGIQNEYIVIGARASVGKTALGMNMTRTLARNGIPTAYFSLEMSSKALLMRMVSDLSTVQAGALRGGFVSEEQLARISGQMEHMAEYKIYPVDNTRGRFDKILSMSRYMVRCLGVKVIFIDHASLMKHRDRKIQRHEQFSEMSNELQNLQRELDVPLILLAQLGRDSEGRRPTLADLRESGGFEQDADQVWLMFRERAKEATDTNIDTEVNIAKNRNGACRTAHLLFQPHFVRFVDKAEKRYEGGRE